MLFITVSQVMGVLLVNPFQCFFFHEINHTIHVKGISHGNPINGHRQWVRLLGPGPQGCRNVGMGMLMASFSSILFYMGYMRYTCIYIYVYVYIYIYASPPLRSTFDALLETYMVKLSAHFKKGCSKFTRYGQTQCTLQLSVQWVHQTWSNSMHTSVKCAVSLITWNFVSRCGSTFDALQETYMVKLTAHFS